MRGRTLYADFLEPVYGRIDRARGAFADLGGSFQTIDNFTSAGQLVRTTANLPNGSLAVDAGLTGLFNIDVQWTIYHNELNGGRNTYLQLYNATDGNPIEDDYELGTARNTNVTAGFATVQVALSNAASGDEVVLRIGDGDSYSDVEIACAMQIWRQDRIRA